MRAPVQPPFAGVSAAANDTDRLLRPALQSLALALAVIVMSMITMVNPAQAEGNVSPATVGWSNVRGGANFGTVAAVCAYTASQQAKGVCTGMVCLNFNETTGIYATWWEPEAGYPHYCSFYSIPAYPVTSCPANATGTTTCTCNTGYQPNATKTQCISDQYTISLVIPPPNEIMPNSSKSGYAYVAKSDGSPKSGVNVDLFLDVVPDDDGQLFSAHVGRLNPDAGPTDVDGRLDFEFIAPQAGGTSTITATCTNCFNQATGTIKVLGCSVPELRKVEDIPPNGPDVLPLTQRLEVTLGADLALLPDAQAGVTCITNKYPSTIISSGTRTVAYQAHLKEIWDKSEELELPKNKNNAACKPLRDKVNAAKGCSGGHCIVFPPAEVSDHPTGKAFDVSRDTINGLRRTLRPALPPGTPPLIEEQQHQADIKLIADWLASPAACNLVWGGSYGDIVHFSIP